MAKERAISFPKVLILEQIEHNCTPLTSFLRIYERKGLEDVHDLSSKGLTDSTLAYIYLKGFHEDTKGQKVDDLANY